MKIGIVGANGRMGRMLVAAVMSSEGAKLSGGTDQHNCPDLGRDLGDLAGLNATGLVLSADVEQLFSVSDVVIDFTVPEATSSHARIAARHQTALVIGTTGLSDDDQAIIDEAATSIPVVQAGNMSLGVNLMTGLAKKVAETLGIEYDIEIVEMHHRHKIDAPSGTALMLGQAAAEGRGVNLSSDAVFVREGHVGARPEGAIGFATLRGGDVVGDHSVIFAGPGERLTVSHQASDRSIFAKGAVRAALWTANREPGHYSMRDVLDL